MNIQTFSFANQSLQIIIKDNQAWFIAREVANLLGYRDAHNLTRLLDDDEKDTHNMSTPSGNQDVSIINESGFYHAAFKSRKAEVKPFRKWVTSEVLPQIRKTGSYQNPASLKTQTALPDCLTLEQQDQIKKLHRQLVQAAPKEQQAKLAITLWSSIKSKFGVSYKKVPSEHYAEVLSLMARVAVERMETLHGEVLDKTQATPFNQTEFACHFVKLLNYARCYLRFQKLLCNDPNSPKAQELLNFFQYSVNVNQTGFLFVFKPDVENDIQKAADFIHHHFQQYDLQMI